MYFDSAKPPQGYVEMLPMEKRWVRALDFIFAWHPFYASLLLELERVETEVLPSGKPLSMMATEGKHLYWNPVSVPKLYQEDLIFMMIHEVEHLRLGHHLPFRCRALVDNNLRQESADHAVNSLLMDLLGIKCSDDLKEAAVLPEKMEMPTGLCMEEYYQRRKEQEQQKEGESESDEEDESDSTDGNVGEDSGDANGEEGPEDSNGRGGGSADDGNASSKGESQDDDSVDSEGDGSREGKTSGSGSGDQSGAKGEGSGKASSPKMSPEHFGEVLVAAVSEDRTETDIENDWQTELVRAEVTAHEAGNLPGYLRQYVEDQLAVKPLPWHRLLKPAFKAIFPSGRSFARPSRRFGWRTDVILPDDKHDGIKDVFFFTDTSGSMSASDMEMTLPHITKILREYPKCKLRVAQFDARICQDKTYRRREWKNIDVDEAAFKGRGGTKFAAAIDLVNREKPKLAIILTDGYPCDGWQETKVPVIWLMTTDVVAPYGKTIPIRQDERGDA